MGVNDLLFPNPDGATPLDDDEAQDLLPDHILTLSQLNEWEQANILQAEEWLFSRKRANILTEPFVRELHQHMFDHTWKWAGVYRQTGNNLGVPASQIATQVRNACDDVTFWLANSVYPLDETAIRLHHRLVSVHPFPNGNGRHTRLMADALLFNNDTPRFTWGSENLQAPGAARSSYLRALRQADSGDISALWAFART